MTHLHTRTAEHWSEIGSDALARRDLIAAEDAFRQALLLDEEHPNALYRLGEFAQHRHDIAAANYWYQRALAAQPGHVAARRRLSALTAASPEPVPEQKPYPPPKPAPPPKLAPPRPPGGSGVVGIVRNYQQHQIQNYNRRSISVIAFRVEVPGQGTLIPVEMRGPELHGSVASGDWVELPERWTPGREPRQVRNLTTGQIVRFGGRGSHRHPLLRSAAWIFAIVMVLVVLAIIAFVVFGMSDPDGFDAFIEQQRAR